jgi:hypothetical protein
VELGTALLSRALESGDLAAHAAELREANEHAAAALRLAPRSARAHALASELARWREPAP